MSKVKISYGFDKPAATVEQGTFTSTAAASSDDVIDLPTFKSKTKREPVEIKTEYEPERDTDGTLELMRSYASGKSSVPVARNYPQAPTQIQSQPAQAVVPVEKKPRQSKLIKPAGVSEWVQSNTKLLAAAGLAAAGFAVYLTAGGAANSTPKAMPPRNSFYSF
jgi:hypothetical protein